MLRPLDLSSSDKLQSVMQDRALAVTSLADSSLLHPLVLLSRLCLGEDRRLTQVALFGAAAQFLSGRAPASVCPCYRPPLPGSPRPP